MDIGELLKTVDQPKNPALYGYQTKGVLHPEQPEPEHMPDWMFHAIFVGDMCNERGLFT